MEGTRTAPEIVTDYGRKLRRLMADLVKKVPAGAGAATRAHVARTQKRVQLAVDTMPEKVIELSGKYLVKYEAAINSEDQADWQRFITDPNAFDGELKAAEGGEHTKTAAQIIPLVQGIIASLDAKGQGECIQTVRDLLDDYLDWLEVQVGGLSL